MGQRVQVLAAIEDFLYEVCLLVVYYPWYLVRLVVRPGETLTEFRDAVEQKRGEELIVSPPLFLFITATITVMFLPPVDLGNHSMFAAFSRMFTADATIGKIVSVCLPVLLLAMCSALLVEWRTPGGVSRESFYLPLFMSVLVSAVLLMVSALANMALEAGLRGSNVGMSAGALALLVGLVWFINAQAKVFILLAGSGRWAAIGYAIAGFALNEAVAQLLPQG